MTPSETIALVFGVIPLVLCVLAPVVGALTLHLFDDD